MKRPSPFSLNRLSEGSASYYLKGRLRWGAFFWFAATREFAKNAPDGAVSGQISWRSDILISHLAGAVLWICNPDE